MDEQVKNRINIIMNFNLYSRKEKFSFKRQYNHVKMTLVIVGFAFLSVAYSLKQSLSFLWHGDFASEAWQGADFTIVVAFISTILVFNSITDFILYRHLLKITKQSRVITEQSNTDLRMVLNKLKDRKRNLFYVIPILILVLAALAHSLHLNPLWDSFAYLVPVCASLFLTKLLLDLRLLLTHLKSVKG